MNGLVLVGFEVMAVAFVDLTLKISIVTFVIVEKVSERVKIGEGSQYVISGFSRIGESSK